MKPDSNAAENTDIVTSIAVYPLESVLLLPGGYLSLRILEPRYIQLVEDSLTKNRLIGIIQFLPDQETVTKKALYEIGSLARIISFSEEKDGSVKISLQGICRFRREKEIECDKPYQCFAITPYRNDFYEEDNESASHREALLDAFSDYFDANNLEADWEVLVQAPMKTLVNGLSSHAPFNTKEKQALLEAPDLKNRAQILIALAERFILAQNGINATDLQ